METVNRDQSLGDRVLGAVRAVESLLYVGDRNASAGNTLFQPIRLR
jgi:hypothetical protein